MKSFCGGSGCFTGPVSRFLEKSPVKHLAAGGKKELKGDSNVRRKK
jgi:hypothetical protein